MKRASKDQIIEMLYGLVTSCSWMNVAEWSRNKNQFVLTHPHAFLFAQEISDTVRKSGKDLTR